MRMSGVMNWSGKEEQGLIKEEKGRRSWIGFTITLRVHQQAIVIAWMI